MERIAANHSANYPNFGRGAAFVKTLRRQRLQDATGVRIEIEDALSGTPAFETPVTRRKSRERLAWSAAVVLFVGFVAAVLLGAVAYFHRAPEDTQAIRFILSPPEGWNLAQSITADGDIAGSSSSFTRWPSDRRLWSPKVQRTGEPLLLVRSLDIAT